MATTTYISQSENMEYIGIEFELSNVALIRYSTNWNSGRPEVLAICDNLDGSVRSKLYGESNSTLSIEAVTGILNSGTYRCYCKRYRGSTSSVNSYAVIGHVFR